MRNLSSNGSVPGYELNEEMELAVVRQLLADPALLPRLARHIQPRRFDHPKAQLVVQLAQSIFNRVGAVPTRVAILQEVREQRTNGHDAPLEEVAEFLERASSVPHLDSRYVLERILNVEKREATFIALEEGMKAYRRGDYDTFLKKAEQAHSVGNLDTTPGLNFRRGIGARSERRRNEGPPPLWGTGIPELDDLIRGLDVGEIGCIMGRTGGGKSICLGHIAMYVMATAGFCVYFSTEISEKLISDRQDSAVSRITTPELWRNADVVESRVNAWLSCVRGGLIIKKIPKYSTVQDLEAYLEDIRVEHGTDPDMIIVDYADEMNPRDPRRFERRDQELVAVHEELRDLCERRSTRCWTASQVNITDALEKKNPDLQDMAGARGKAFKDDIVVAICQTREEMNDNYLRFYVAKGRNAPGGKQTDSLPNGFAIGRMVLNAPWLDYEISSR